MQIFHLQAFGSDELVCPTDKQAASLDSWRDKAISSVVSGQYSLVKNKVKECFTDKVPSCLNELIYHLDLKKTGRVNFATTDPGIDENEPVEGYHLKSVSDLPSEFHAKSSLSSLAPDSVKIPPNLFSLAKEKGWKAISYKTRSTGGFDTPPNLTLIAIPGRDKDIFLQISPKPDNNHAATNDNPVPQGDATVGQATLTIISVDKTKRPPVGQLKKLLSENNINNNTYAWKNKTDSQSCTRCHTTPLRTISPIGYRVTNGTEKRMSLEDERTVTEINDMMIGEVSWGKAKVDGYEIKKGASASSQPYGWTPPNSTTRTESFLKTCAVNSKYFSYDGFGGYAYSVRMKDTPQINYEKVSRAMNCVQCHNGNVRGSLHEDFNFDEIRFKIMVDRSMPPGQQLNTDERIALVNCLRAEYSKVSAAWKKSGEWMKKDECTAMTESSRTSNSRRTRPVGLTPVEN